MNDINFFEPYLDKKGIKFNNKLLLISIVGLLVISIALYAVFNLLRIKNLNSSVNEYKGLAENPKTVKKVKLIKGERDELNNFEREIEAMRNLESYVSTKDIIDSDYIKEITSKIPDGLFLTSFNLEEKNLNISGISQENLSIAEFAKGLQGIDVLDDIFINDISKEEMDYIFTLESNELGEDSEDEIEDLDEEGVGDDGEEPKEDI